MIVSFSLLACLVVQAAPSGQDSTASGDSPLAPFLSVDRQLGIASLDEPAKMRAARIRDALDACVDAAHRRSDAVRCLVRVVTGDTGIRAADVPESWTRGSVSYALKDGRGTCAALAAITLALGKDRDVPVRLVVLGTHVVAQDASDPTQTFELLDRGRETTLEEVSRRTRAAGPPKQVNTIKEFLPFYWDQLAVRASEDGENAVAEKAFREVVRLTPRAWRVRFNYGTHLLTRGRTNEARRQLKRATRLDCPLAECWSNLGVAYATLGDERRAVRSFEHALTIDPDHPDALRNLAQIRPQPAQ